MVDFPHGLRNSGIGSHWRLLPAPDAIKPRWLWSPKAWPISGIRNGCWIEIPQETSESRKSLIVMWKRTSSCCAGGNVNWTAILKSNLSEPREVKDMHNVKFFNVSCKQGFWSRADYYYLQRITSPLPLCLSCLPSGNTMRTTCHPTHTKVCIIGKEPWKHESGYLHRGGTTPPLIWKKRRKIFAPWEGCWVLTLNFWMQINRSMERTRLVSPAW